jgi:hypothetical protein
MLIKDVFEQFLSEQQSQLAPKTYRAYASVIELFEHQLEGYAWNNLANGQKAYETAQKKGKSFEWHSVKPKGPCQLELAVLSLQRVVFPYDLLYEE